MNILDYLRLCRNKKLLEGWLHLQDFHDHHIVALVNQAAKPTLIYRFTCLELGLVDSIRYFEIDPEENVPAPILFVDKKLQTMISSFDLSELESAVAGEKLNFFDKMIVHQLLNTFVSILRIESSNKRKYQDRLGKLLSMAYSNRLAHFKGQAK